MTQSDNTAQLPKEAGAVGPDVANVGRGLFAFSATQLLVVLLLFFAVTPFVEDLPNGEAIEGVVLSIVLLSAMLAVGGRRQTLVVTGILLAPTLIAKWVHHLAPGYVPEYVFPATALAFTAFIALKLLTFVFRARIVTHEIVSAAISAYLVLGLAWAFAYRIVAETTPGAFMIASPPGSVAPEKLDSFTAFYFSFITLITIGYGDVTPVTKGARMLAVCEGLTGTLFTVTLLSRLVSMYTPHRRPLFGPVERSGPSKPGE